MTDEDLCKACVSLADRMGNDLVMERLGLSQQSRELMRDLSTLVKELVRRLDALNWLDGRKKLLGDKVPRHVVVMAQAVMRGDLAAAFGLIDAMQEARDAGVMRAEDMVETRGLHAALRKDFGEDFAHWATNRGVVETFVQLTAKTEEEVLEFRRMGPKRVAKLKEFLAGRGLKLRG